MPMIEFHNVSKRYSGSSGGNDALSNLSFSVQGGELVYLSGPSGAGKSTVLKMLAAIEQPSSGSIKVGGQDIGAMQAKALPYFRRKLGLIFPQHGLLPDRSVIANIMLPLLVSGTATDDAEKRARAALDKVGLSAKTADSPLALSGGEQQRAAIARAIVHRPQIILADEPTANLDRESAARVLDVLTAFHDSGVTCLISTHDEQLLEQAQRVIYLDRGRLRNASAGGQVEQFA